MGEPARSSCGPRDVHLARAGQTGHTRVGDAHRDPAHVATFQLDLAGMDACAANSPPRRGELRMTDLATRAFSSRSGMTRRSIVSSRRVLSSARARMVMREASL